MSNANTSSSSSLWFLFIIIVAGRVIWEDIRYPIYYGKNTVELFEEMIGLKIDQSKNTRIAAENFVNIRNGIDLTDVDTDKYSIELLEAVGVKFPIIHGILIPFKESSFCRENNEDNYPTFCNDEWSHIIGVDWNPYNPNGMKYPKYRPTTAICSIGDMLQSFVDKYDVRIRPKYRKMLDDPHSCYIDYVDAAIDIRLWQEYWFKAKGKVPKTRRQYIAFLKEVGYNPYDTYYRNKRGSGMYQLLDQLERGTFKKKYGHYYSTRMYEELPDRIPKDD